MMNTCVKVRPLAGLAMLLTILLLGGIMPKAHASHFRYGSLSWKARPDIGANTAELSLSDAFRRDGYSGSGADGYPVTGDIIHEDIGATNLFFGDGASTGSLSYLVIAYDQASNFVYCKAIADPKNLGLPILHTYGGSGPWTANIDSSARISDSINSPGGEYRVQTNIDFATTSVSPVSTLPAVLNCTVGGIYSFTVPAASSEGDALVWRLAAPSEDGNISQPSRLTVDAKGNVRWNTTGLTLGLYSCQIVIEAHDAKTGVYKTQIGVDFLLNLTQGQPTGNPPVFIQSAPTNGTQFDVATDKELTFEVKAQADPGKTVTLNAIGLPSGASMLPALPLSGNPVISVFRWTPSLLQTGPTVVVFTAKDTAGLETDCSIIVNVLLDSDGDGLPDDWEVHGYTYNGKFVDLPKMGANLFHKDVFVQVDYMVDGGFLGTGLFGHSHKPDQGAIDTIVQSFAHAPVSNPDGIDGISLHVNVVNAVPEVSTLGGAPATGGNPSDYDWTDFDGIKKIYFPTELSFSEHYCLFAHTLGGYSYSYSGITRATSSAQGEFIPGSDFIVALYNPYNSSIPNGKIFQQAGTFMHELGHSLGLQHGGGDSINYKPNYLSVMNYSFQNSGLYKNGGFGLFDYSRSQLPALDEYSLFEPLGLNGGLASMDYGTMWSVQNSQFGYDQKFTPNANGPIDWNGDGVIEPGLTVLADIHQSNSKDQPPVGQGLLKALNGYDDWANLNYTGGVIGAGINLPQPQVTVSNELDFITAAQIKPFPLFSITGRVGVKSVRLAWKALGPPTEFTYRVYSRTGNAAFVLRSAAAAPLVSYTSLTSGLGYSFYVTSVNALGAESIPSPMVVLTPL